MSGQDHIPTGGVVVGVDGSPHAERAAVWAADHAARRHRPLVLVHADDPFSTTHGAWLASAGIDPVALQREVEQASRLLLDRTAASVRAGHPLLEVVTVHRPTDPRHALIDASAEADTVVVGSRGRGPLASLLLGSVSTAVVKHAACPVAVVPGGRAGEPRGSVLAGVEGRAPERAVLEVAYAEADARRVPLTVLHCYWDALGIARTTLQVADDDHTVDDLRRLLAEATAGMAERYPDVEVRLELAPGAPEQLLVLAAETHDLVVVGHRHAGALSASLRGSSAVTVVELSSAPVLVVPLAAPERSQAHVVRAAGR